MQKQLCQHKSALSCYGDAASLVNPGKSSAEIHSFLADKYDRLSMGWCDTKSFFVVTLRTFVAQAGTIHWQVLPVISGDILSLFLSGSNSQCVAAVCELWHQIYLQHKPSARETRKIFHDNILCLPLSLPLLIISLVWSVLCTKVQYLRTPCSPGFCQQTNDWGC